MQELSQTLQDVPLAGMVPLVLLLLVGLVLWGAGNKVFRAAFAVVGLLLGAGIGWLLGGTLNLGMPAWVVAVVGAVLLACVAAVTYRLAIAGALALVLGVASPLAVLTINEWQSEATEQRMIDPADELDEPLIPAGTEPMLPEADPDETIEDVPGQALDEIDRWLRERFGEEIRRHLPIEMKQELQDRELDDDLAAELEEQLEKRNGWFFRNGEFDEQIEAVRNMAERVAQALREVWRDSPESLRPILVGAAIVGGLLGVLIGALVPTFSTTIVTAFLGSLLWLTSLRVIAEKLTVSETIWLPDSGTAWLSTWVLLALIGLGIQWTLLRRKADKPAGSAA
jgi:hypothetical protein